MAYFMRWLQVTFRVLGKRRLNSQVVILLVLLTVGIWGVFNGLAETKVNYVLFGLGGICFLSCVYNLSREKLSLSLESGMLKSVLPVSKKPRQIDSAYFVKDYAHSGRSYAEVRKMYSSSDECISLFKESSAPSLRKMQC